MAEDERIARIEARMDYMQGDIAEIKATLAQLVPVIIRIDQKLSDMPTQAEVAELRGRVEEQSKFLQLALAGRQKRPAAE